MVLNLKVDFSQSFQGKRHYLGLGSSKLKAAHPVDYLLGFGGINIKNCSPVKLILFASLLDAALIFKLNTSVILYLFLLLFIVENGL